MAIRRNDPYAGALDAFTSAAREPGGDPFAGALDAFTSGVTKKQERTDLSPLEEPRFRAWARQSNVTDVDAPDSYYDYRGLYKELGGKPVPISPDRHFPDTYKTHGHPTFSIESQYSTGPDDGGSWQGETYVPAGTKPKIPSIRERAAASMERLDPSLKGSGLAEVKRRALANTDDADFAEFKRMATAGGTPVDDATLERAWRASKDKTPNLEEGLKEGIRTSTIPTLAAGIENMTPRERAVGYAKIIAGSTLGPLGTIAGMAGASTPSYKAGAENLRETAAMANKGDRDSLTNKAGQIGGGFIGDAPIYLMQPEVAVPKIAQYSIARRLGTEATGQLVQMLAKQGVNVPVDMLIGTVDALAKSGEMPSAKEIGANGVAAFVFRNLMHVGGKVLGGKDASLLDEATPGQTMARGGATNEQIAQRLGEVGNVSPELAAVRSGADLNAPEAIVPRGHDQRVADIPIGADQRVSARRSTQPLEEMTPDELRAEAEALRADNEELWFDKRHGLKTMRHYDPSAMEGQAHVYMDVMGMRELNNRIGMKKTDDILKLSGELARKHNLDAIVKNAGTGDEMFSVVADADLPVFAKNLENFKRDFAAHTFETTDVNGNNVALTGFGVHHSPVESGLVARTLEEADDALSRAKERAKANGYEPFRTVESATTGERAGADLRGSGGGVDPIGAREQGRGVAGRPTEIGAGEPSKVAPPEPPRNVPPGGEPPVPPGAVPPSEPPRIGANADTGGDTVGPSKPTVPLDWDAYVKDRVAKTEAAKKVGRLTLKERFLRSANRSKAAVVDMLSPIEDPIRQAYKKLGIETLPSQDITNALDGSIKAATKAESFMETAGFNRIIQDVPDTDALGQFLLSRHAKALEANGKKAGSGIVQYDRIPDNVKAIYEPYAKQIDAYLRELLEYRVKMGTVTREYADLVNELYPEYVPFDRIFGENELPTDRGHGAGLASLSKQTTDLRIVGSERIPDNPLHAIFEKTVNSYNEGERNFAASIVAKQADLPGNPIGLRILRSADNVKKRIAIIKDLAAIGKESRALRRVAGSTNRAVKQTGGVVDRMFANIDKRIASEAEESQSIYEAMRTHAADFANDHATDGMLTNSLSDEKNIARLQERYSALSSEVDDLTREGSAIYESARVAAGDGATPEQINRILDQGLRVERKLGGDERTVGAIGRRDAAADLYDQTSAADFRIATRAAEDANLDRIDALESRGLRAERNLYELQGQREQIDYSHAAEKLAELKKTASALDIALSERAVNVKKMRGELLTLRDALRKPSDTTFSYLKDGVRETWAAPEPIVSAMKSLNVEQMQTWMRVLAAPVRVSKVLMTGINAGFFTRNPVKDFPTGIVNSEAGFAMVGHMWRGLREALGHGEFYQEMASRGGKGTSFDQFRVEPTKTLAKIRSQKNIASSAKYIITTPKEWLRFVEDIVGRTEEFSRLTAASAEQARLSKTDLIRNSPNPEEEALIGATKAFLWSTAPFHRHGEVKALRAATLYLPSGIQGNRATLGALRDRPAATLAKIGITTVLPVLTITAWNLSDPKRKAIYDQLKSYEKDNSLIIVGNDAHLDPATNRMVGVYKIPLQQNLAKFATLARRPMEAYADLDPLKFGEMASTLLGIASPISTPNELVSVGMIHAVKPILETQIGRGGTDTFRNADIEPRFLWDKPPEERVRENTSGTARLLAKPFGAGPMKAEYLFGGYGGGGGKQILNASDHVLAAMGAIPPEQIGGIDPVNLMSRGYFGASAMTSGEIQKRDEQRHGGNSAASYADQQAHLRRLMRPGGK